MERVIAVDSGHSLSTKPSIVLHGNCQVALLAAMLRADANVADAFDVAFSRSYEDPAVLEEPVTLEVAARALVLFEQVGPDEFGLRSFVPPYCRTVTFPSLDLNVLWPLHCSNPYTVERSPYFVAGQFPYGDSVIVDCVRQGMSVDETLAFYEKSSEEYLPRLDRLYRLEMGRLAARDVHCTIPMGSFISSEFARRRLFWSNNHPTPEALAELCYRLVESVKELSAVFVPPSDATISQTPQAVNLAWFKIPIHPAVGRYFNLSWYPDMQEPVYSVRNAPATYAEYFQAMTASAVEARSCVHQENVASV